MKVKSPARNNLCSCRSGKKYKKCCFLKKPHVAGLEFPPYITPVDRRPKVHRRPGQLVAGRQEAAHPEQPKPVPPKGAEWKDHFFVIGKGWKHERDLQPGDQLRQKDGGWVTFEGGRVVGTTHEHPYFVKGLGWAAVWELQVGDQVKMPEWATVEAVEDTGRLARVYNLEVEEDHTYFVGGDDWGFAVWAHNAVYGETYYETKRLLSDPHKTVGWTEGRRKSVERAMKAAETKAIADARAAGLLTKGVGEAAADAAFVKYVLDNMHAGRDKAIVVAEARAALTDMKHPPFSGDRGTSLPAHGLDVPALELTPQQLADGIRGMGDLYGPLHTPEFKRFAGDRFVPPEMQGPILAANRARNGGDVVRGDFSGIVLDPAVKSMRGQTQGPFMWSFDHKVPFNGKNTTFENIIIEAQVLNFRKHKT